MPSMNSIRYRGLHAPEMDLATTMHFADNDFKCENIHFMKIMESS